MQLAGNGFLLVDLTALEAKRGDTKSEEGKPNGPVGPGLQISQFGEAARILCNRKYGIGANGTIFLSADNTIRMFSPRGKPVYPADDAMLCAARFAFDSGRAASSVIEFNTIRGPLHVDVLGAHQFRLSLGSPFSLLNGALIGPDCGKLVETIKHEDIEISCSAVHIRQDVVTAFPRSLGTLDYSGFAKLVKRAFPEKRIIPVIAQSITRDTVILKVRPRHESAACASAAAALVTAVCSGLSGYEILVLFETPGSDGQPNAIVARDRDNTNKLAARWEPKENELYVIGSGGYVFEGKFDLHGMLSTE
ncbi:MAG TPA: hypothetical protein GXZ47_04750 [Treponema sp.]|nr:hypothetical protein [Treponema sp.]